MTCGFWLKRQIESPHFTKVEHLERDDWTYRFRVTSADQLDDEVLGWIREAYDVGPSETPAALAVRRGDRLRRRGQPIDLLPRLDRRSPSTVVTVTPSSPISGAAPLGEGSLSRSWLCSLAG